MAALTAGEAVVVLDELTSLAALVNVAVGTFAYDPLLIQVCVHGSAERQRLLATLGATDASSHTPWPGSDLEIIHFTWRPAVNDCIEASIRLWGYDRSLPQSVERAA